MTGQEIIDREKARKLQAQADRLTKRRYDMALPLSAVLAATPASWFTAAANAELWHTDFRDGERAKAARKFWHDMPRTRISRLDPAADRRLAYGNRFALFARSIASGDSGSALLTAAETSVSLLRDRRMAETRAIAETHGIGVDAIDINRAKTWITGVSQVVELSPLANNDAIRRTAQIVRCGATVLGIVGAELYRHQVMQGIAAQQQPAS